MTSREGEGERGGAQVHPQSHEDKHVLEPKWLGRHHTFDTLVSSREKKIMD